VETTIKDFEAAIAELEAIVKKLEDGDLALEQSLALYERGVQLSRFCHAQLEEAERRIEILNERGELKPALLRARRRLSHASVDGVEWYWPAEEAADADTPQDTVHFLAPFDPVVWDRRRFELLWGWAYRFEAYTPEKKRTRGYYALPLLWRERVIGWANVSVTNGALEANIGYVSGRPPREPRFRQALDSELDSLRRFLGLDSPAS